MCASPCGSWLTSVPFQVWHWDLPTVARNCVTGEASFSPPPWNAGPSAFVRCHAVDDSRVSCCVVHLLNIEFFGGRFFSYLWLFCFGLCVFLVLFCYFKLSSRVRCDWHIY